MSIDFLFGMVILITAVAFVAQFATTSIIPFTQSDEDATVVVQKVSENLMYDEESPVYDERDGRIALPSDLENEVDSEELGVPTLEGEPRYNLNVTVSYVEEGDDTPSTKTSGPPVPGVNSQAGSSSSVASVARVGYIDDETTSEDLSGDGTVSTVRVRVW